MDLVKTDQSQNKNYQKYKDDIDDKTTQILIDNKETPPKYKNLIKKNEIKKPLIGIVDVLISILILSPCVVGVWRGTWQLMDINSRYFPPWKSFIVGLIIHFAFIMTQDIILEFVKKKTSNIPRKIFNQILTRLYIYVSMIACNMHWRGAWIIIDHYLGVQKNSKGYIIRKNSEVMLVISGGCFLLTVGLRSLCNCMAPPFVFCIDTKHNTFTIPTRFRAKVNEKTFLYILDCLFSVLVIGTLVVFVWRGAWALIDIFLFPENEVLSAWGSLIVGYSSVAIAFMLQPIMKWLCDRVTGVVRLLAADLFLILSLIGTVNVWRGIWNLLNIYLLPDNLELSCWITHWICLIILILLGCSNSLLVRGVYIDAEEPAGKCVIFPCYYLRLIFQEQKLKKLQSAQNKTEMVNVKPFENNHIVNINEPPSLSINHIKEEDEV